MSAFDPDAEFVEWAAASTLADFETFARAMHQSGAEALRQSAHQRMLHNLEDVLAREVLDHRAERFQLPSNRRLAHLLTAVAALEHTDDNDEIGELDARRRAGSATATLTLMHPTLIGRYLELDLPLRTLDAVTAAIADGAVPVQRQIDLLERAEGGGHPFRTGEERTAPEIAWVKERLAGCYERLARRESRVAAATSRAIAARHRADAQRMRDGFDWGLG